MAAITYDASSSSSTIARKYQVFLSFRGKDTYNTFTGHLYNALQQSCISTYMANLDLEQGDKIWPAMVDAIKESKIFIPIFSQNYASSKWCLNELIKAMECRQERGQLILPIFYHVDPRHVRNQMEDFGNGFEDLASRFEEEMVNKWKTAMKEAGEMKGWDLNADTNG